MGRLELQIGRRIRTFREQKGWFQRELAQTARLPVRTIGRIERGEVDVRINTLARIAAVLGVPLRELIP
jgi:transcriptional regulator with XRE-family HTH domain